MDFISLLAIVVVFVIAAIDYILRRNRSKAEDEAANELLRALQSDPKAFESRAKFFWLYLRPFIEKGRIFLKYDKDSSYDMSGEYKGAGRLTTSIEETLASALAISNQGVLIALGEKHIEMLGGGRITVLDEKWKPTALSLAKACRGILLVPTTSPGVLWEVEEIIRLPELRIKTIVFMPPSRGFFRDRNRRVWTRAGEVLSQVGMHLPKHRIKGALMRISRDGGTFGHVVPKFDSEAELSLQITNLLNLPDTDENREIGY